MRDLGGCGTVTGEVFLLNYPKFFTPNGDGYNDYWRVKYSEREPHMMTYVFDRYGKLITGFLPDSPGWDGRYNGEPLPSTDYWFLVIREDGRQRPPFLLPSPPTGQAFGLLGLVGGLGLLIKQHAARGFQGHDEFVIA